MNERGILDTNSVILLSRFSDTTSLPGYPVITTITLAELSVVPHVASNDIERAARQAHLQQAESDFEPLPFDSAAARAFGRVANDLRLKGRKHKACAYDALIDCLNCHFTKFANLYCQPRRLPGHHRTGGRSTYCA